jgi:hypothetical protein
MLLPIAALGCCYQLLHWNVAAICCITFFFHYFYHHGLIFDLQSWLLALNGLVTLFTILIVFTRKVGVIWFTNK